MADACNQSTRKGVLVPYMMAETLLPFQLMCLETSIDVLAETV